jgi:hypothetical protein
MGVCVAGGGCEDWELRAMMGGASEREDMVGARWGEPGVGISETAAVRAAADRMALLSRLRTARAVR